MRERALPAAVLVLAALFAGAARAQAPAERVLRVCADPNALPFSNDRLQGFENRIAELLARELNARVEYTFRAGRRGFLRDTLQACACDVVMGLPVGVDAAATTRPYYRSTYVSVSRRDRRLSISSLDDPRLARLRVGVQTIGAEAASSPPAHALARRGIEAQVVGFPVSGDAGEENAASRIVQAVESGEVDVAFVWGPLAGFFAKESPVPLEVVPLSGDVQSAQPYTFDIAVGVRRGEKELLHEVDAALSRLGPRIEEVLDRYGVPREPPRPAVLVSASRDLRR